MVNAQTPTQTTIRNKHLKIPKSEVFGVSPSKSFLASLTSKAKRKKVFLPPSTSHHSDWERGTTSRMPTSSQVLRNRGTGGVGLSPLDVGHWSAQSPSDDWTCGGPGSASVLPPVPFKVPTRHQKWPPSPPLPHPSHRRNKEGRLAVPVKAK